MNEGGRVFYTGRRAGQQHTGVLGTQFYDPTAANAQCSTLPPTVDERRCLPLNGSGDLTGDVLQYWLGAYIVNLDAGNNGSAGLFDVNGIGAPLTGLHWGFNGADSAQNQTNSSSFITTSGILAPATYPQFQSSVAAKWDRPGGPFDPHSGTKYMYSQIGDISYKRLTRTITVPAGGANLSFWTSYNTEEHWDHVFVEAHGPQGRRTGRRCRTRTATPARTPATAVWPVGATCTRTWTTTRRSTPTGPARPPARRASGTPRPEPSGGWQQWSVNLNAYAGKQVEISIAYASDWSVQGLGTFVDDITVSTGEGTTSFEDDAVPQDGWAVTGPPAGSGPNPNNFVRTGSRGLPGGCRRGDPALALRGLRVRGHHRRRDTHEPSWAGSWTTCSTEVPVSRAGNLGTPAFVGEVMELTCPKCQGAMRSYERNGVTIDQCSECRGIFLDRGELERLVDAENAWHGARQPEAPRQQAYSEPDHREGSYGGHQAGGLRPEAVEEEAKSSFFEELFD